MGFKLAFKGLTLAVSKYGSVQVPHYELRTILGKITSWTKINAAFLIMIYLLTAAAKSSLSYSQFFLLSILSLLTYLLHGAESFLSS